MKPHPFSGRPGSDPQCGHAFAFVRVFLPNDVVGYICRDCVVRVELYGNLALVMVNDKEVAY